MSKLIFVTVLLTAWSTITSAQVVAGPATPVPSGTIILMDEAVAPPPFGWKACGFFHVEHSDVKDGVTKVVRYACFQKD